MKKSSVQVEKKKVQTLDSFGLLALMHVHIHVPLSRKLSIQVHCTCTVYTCAYTLYMYMGVAKLGGAVCLMKRLDGQN